MRVWIGKTIGIIGLIHTVFGLVVFRDVIFEIFRRGFFNTIQEQPLENYAFWFIFFGFFTIILGLTIDFSERFGIAFPQFFGWIILAVTLLLIAIMPISGGWLFLIPAIGLIWQNYWKNIKPQTNSNE